MTTPVGQTASGRRHARATAQPAARATRNGQNVVKKPPGLSCSPWLDRPITTNTSTSTRSTTAATGTGDMLCTSRSSHRRLAAPGRTGVIGRPSCPERPLGAPVAGLAVDAAQLRQRGELAREDPLDAVPASGADDADVAHEAHQAVRLEGRR